MTDTHRLFQSRYAYATLLAWLFLVQVAGGPLYGKAPEWLEELNRMERQADDARYAFWCGRYEEAAQAFSTLADSVHPSVMLYLNECDVRVGPRQLRKR